MDKNQRRGSRLIAPKCELGVKIGDGNFMKYRKSTLLLMFCMAGPATAQDTGADVSAVNVMLKNFTDLCDRVTSRILKTYAEAHQKAIA